MTQGLESGYGFGCQPAILEVDLVGKGLVVDARRAHRVGKRHPVIDDIGDHLGYRRDDRRAAGRSHHHHEASVWVEHDGRCHCREHSLSRLDGVGLPLNETVRALP